MKALQLHERLIKAQDLQQEVDSYMKAWNEIHIETALCEEFHEWYNALGLFKDWKKHKTAKEKQLDELADCLAFALSLLNHKHKTFSYDRSKFTLKRISNKEHKNAMLNEIKTGYLFNKRVGTTVYIQEPENAIELIIDIAILFYTLEELFEAYEKKSLVNIQRQKDGY